MRMPPPRALPISEEFSNPESYVDSLLEFTGSSTLFQTFCGHIHILDFLIQEPDLYSAILPEEWQSWFGEHDVDEILYLLVKDSLLPLGEGGPPGSLVDFIQGVRRHSLDRTWSAPTTLPHLPYHVSVGMRQKKIHEVQSFAQYINDISLDKGITHLVDFGSGQNYLGRVLASPPYNKRIVAIESKRQNIEGARKMDVTAGLANIEKVKRDKKRYRMQQEIGSTRTKIPSATRSNCEMTAKQQNASVDLLFSPSATEQRMDGFVVDQRPKADLKITYMKSNSIQYIEHVIKDGNISDIVGQIAHISSGNLGPPSSESTTPLVAERQKTEPQSFQTTRVTKVMGSSHSEDSGLEPTLLVMALHSCGNLLHHGIRSLLLNPSVKMIVLVGCCYNLVSERLGPPSFKLPSLRPPFERAERLSSAFDPHGFPMSERMSTHNGTGVHLNITARMMALQAPENWTKLDSEAFFKRHFFRALLQRILYDKGLVSRSAVEGRAAANPIIIGSLRKSCYNSFNAYVRGSLVKLSEDSSRAKLVEERLEGLTDEQIEAYEVKYGAWKKKLSVIWCLMAFSAQLAEAIIIVDRWLFLKEHPNTVKECWVETVFDYGQSPRNLVVVGVKN